MCTGLLWVCLPAPVLAGQPGEPKHPATNPAHDLTGKEFLKDIGHNFAALFQTKSILPVAIGAAGTGLSAMPEQWLERHFAPGNVWGAWGSAGSYIGNPAVLASTSGLLFAVSRKSENSRFRSMSYSLVHGAIMTASVVQTTKPIFGRLRPNGEDHHAFPSGHATDSFMFATVVAEHYGWKTAIPGYAFASYVAASRLEERKHNLTDVAAGAAIGYLIGKTVTRRMVSDEPSRFGWQVLPTRRGFSVSLRVALP